MGRTKPKTILELMEVANRFADGEDAYHNKRARSPECDRPNRYNSQRRRSRNNDGHNSQNEVATGYKRNSKEGSERQNNSITTEKIQVAIDQETSTHHPKTSSMDHVTYTTHM
jgi:hypothetical protein